MKPIFINSSLKMKNHTSINMNIYLRSFLIISAICLLGLTGCTSAGTGRVAQTRYVCEQK
jgi:hypothetical protein